MSTKQIRWIVLSMAIGLLGLVGFQLYWISNALHLQKEQFDYKVTDALREVIRSLERQEAQYQVRQRLATQQQQQQIRAIGKATTLAETNRSVLPAPSPARRSARQRQRAATFSPLHQPEEGMPGTVTIQMDALQPIQRSLTPEQLRTVDAFYKQQDELIAVGDLEAQLAQQERFGHWIDQVMESHVNEVLRSSSGFVVPDSVFHSGRAALTPLEAYTKAHTKSKRTRAKKPILTSTITLPAPAVSNMASNRPGSGTSVSDQSEMIKDIFRGVLMADRPLTERVNRFMLDTLLRQALNERGINILFDYAVRSQQQGDLLFTSTGLTPNNMPVAKRTAVQQQFEKSSYKAALFPNNMLETGNYIYLFFPDQRAFILSRMTATLAGSAILILVIMGCFYVAITTILRQKKLADIKNDFINNMTHEFKTPISTISLAVEMAQEQLRPAVAMNALAIAQLGPETSYGETPVDQRLTRYMGIIRDENRRLGSHVEKVLQMALLDRGEIILKLSPVNIHDIIEKVLNNIGLQIEQREGEVELLFDAETEILEADELHLTNILYNLLDNAIKYSPDKPHITLQTRSLPESISVTVTDRGLGMTKDQISRVFEKFYRVPTGNRHDVKGFGLGLSYVRKMVDEHHGQIRVESQPGQGSSFEIELPYKQGE